MSDDKTFSDLDAVATAAADSAAAARTTAEEAQAAADTAAEKAKAALEKTTSDPNDDAAKTASVTAATDASTKADAAKTADEKATAAEATSKVAAAAAAAAKAAPSDLTTKTPPQKDLSVQPAAQTSYFDLLKAVVVDPKMTGSEKEQLLMKLKGMSPTSDRWTFRWAIWILGFVSILTVVAIWCLAMHNQGEDVPAGLVAIGSSAAGALAGLLNSSRGSEPHS